MLTLTIALAITTTLVAYVRRASARESARFNADRRAIQACTAYKNSGGTRNIRSL